MIINFALTLTYSGIDLLQRTDDGWRRVGSASLLSADLVADLAELRAKGLALAPEGLRTKLVIPTEQVKYLSIDTTLTSDADIAEAVDGTTPYALDDLVIDHERSGGRTHIAAVAKETLQEAEVFAKAHGFNPVSFVAVPDPFTFQQEIFFGTTDCAADILGPDAVLTRDPLPVMLTGTRIKSRVLVVEKGDVTKAAPKAATAPMPATFTMDRIIAEYHAGPRTASGAKATPVVTEPRLPPRAVASPLPVALLDPVIGEYHSVPPQTEVPMIAVAAAGLPRPVVLGGVMEPTTAPAIPFRPYAVPAGIAASVAVLGLALWAFYAPAPSDDTATLQRLNTSAALIDVPIPDNAAEISLADAAIGADVDQVFVDGSAALQQPAPPSDLLAVAPDDLLATTPDQSLDRPATPLLPGADMLATDLAFIAPEVPALDAPLDVANSEADDTPAISEDIADSEAAQAETESDETPVELAAVEADDDSGVTILAVRPSVVPRPRPQTASLPEEDAGQADATAGGVSLAGLQPDTDRTTAAEDDLAPPPGAIRPRLRPDLPEVATNSEEVDALLGGIAFAQPEDIVDASEQAVAFSLRPTSRPNNFERVVANARSRQQPAPEPQATPEPEPAPVVAAAPPAAAAPAPAPAPAAAPAPPPPPAQAAAPVAPQNYAPVPGGVARAATQTNAIRLRDVNLIGVYGQANARRALVRLGNGQYVRVQVGSELDGGQVTAIGDNALNYVKRGTTYALQIPQG